ncbi:hypothetical protein [Serpentinicella alkaliphila]|uniref:Uncharacterized protein n=1 Tax=Serpentinicella alkaliphila TaxID=1734049 RepID=A0A4R2TJG3_9FIRM|nr:hypothetical protein [Serpentinicella alkaliphila]QUH26619.1 hypothetical protein HZR23_13395 [Serpentinicella alkaliphila]TCQ02916.1 hypothetical protein EDD79_101246 [Serpentinicella alkaliphila]
MENIEELLQQILNNQNDLKQDLSDIKSKLNSVVEQTSDLTEFKTHTNQNFNDIKDTLKFLLHKEIETEREIFKLKQIKEIK